MQQRRWGLNIGHFLAKKLQSQGAHIAALTFKKSAHQFLLEQQEVRYDRVTNHDEIMANPKKYLADDDYTLEEICQDIGVDSVWPFVNSIRLYVRSYKDKYYYGFKQNVSDEQIIFYIKAFYKYLKTTFEEFKPEVILLPNFVDFSHMVTNMYAMKRGIRMIGVEGSRVVKDMFLFSYDHLFTFGPFHNRVKELNEGKADSQNRDKAKKYIAEFRQKFKTPSYMPDLKKKKSLKQRIRHELSPYYHILCWYINRPINLIGNLGVSLDYRPPQIILRDFYAHRRYKKFMENYSYSSLDKIGKYVYFPFSFEHIVKINATAG